MLLINNILLLIVNAVTFRREFTIASNRVAIFILLYLGIIGHSVYLLCLDTGIGIYNGLFHSTITLEYKLLYAIAPIVLLTAFYVRFSNPRREIRGF